MPSSLRIRTVADRLRWRVVRDIEFINFFFQLVIISNVYLLNMTKHSLTSFFKRHDKSLTDFIPSAKFRTAFGYIMYIVHIYKSNRVSCDRIKIPQTARDCVKRRFFTITIGTFYRVNPTARQLMEYRLNILQKLAPPVDFWNLAKQI